MGHREPLLNRVLVQFAANLCTDFSVQSILDHLVLSIVDLLPVSGAGVMAIDSSDALHFLAATDDVIRTIEVLQRETGQGPCLHAHATGRPCVLDDLRAGEDFPEFSRRALEAGMAAVFSFPLRAQGRTLGALDLYRTTPGPLGEADVRIVAILADVAAACLVNARSRADSSLIMADLNHRSLHDPLTGLPNRTLLTELLTEALNRATRSRRRTAVLFLDLEGFKAVNDELGHHVGDLLLVAVAARLTAALRPGDTLARLGGDEFVAVCDDLPDDSHAADVSHRLLSAMVSPFHLEGRDVTLGASIGVALSDRRHPVGAQQLLVAADAAMYEAKRAGGGRHHLIQEAPSLSYPAGAHPAETHPAVAATEVTSVTAPSLPTTARLTGPPASTPRGGSPASARGRWGAGDFHESDRYTTVYQPIVAVHDKSVTGQVIGVETLLRWGSALPGALPPAAVVAEAERSGAIFGLGDWVLRQACRDTVRWQEQGIGVQRTSVNVSAQQITGPAFVRSVERALADTGADPGCLCLELTESSTLPDDRRTVEVLLGLKKLGLQLWLDDFGSGYSSLNYLRVFPLDVVKIDPSFAHRLPGERASRAIVASTTALCHELGMTVIVEGVENVAELQAATDLGVDACQGFFLGRPVPAEEVRAFSSAADHAQCDIGLNSR